MTTYNTGNPVPSADARDRYDNSQTLDQIVNGTLTYYPNRIGQNALSLAGMQGLFNTAQLDRATAFNAAQAARDAAFARFLEGTNWSSLGVYAAGISIISHTQTVDYLGQPYSLKPSIPVSLDAPYVTTGAWSTEGVNFKLVGDNSLRQDLARKMPVSLWDRASFVVNKPNVADPSTWDWTPALQALVDEGVPISVPPGVFPLFTPVYVKQGTSIIGTQGLGAGYIQGSYFKPTTHAFLSSDFDLQQVFFRLTDIGFIGGTVVIDLGLFHEVDMFNVSFFNPSVGAMVLVRGEKHRFERIRIDARSPAIFGFSIGRWEESVHAGYSDAYFGADGAFFDRATFKDVALQGGAGGYFAYGFKSNILSATVFDNVITHNDKQAGEISALYIRTRIQMCVINGWAPDRWGSAASPCPALFDLAFVNGCTFNNVSPSFAGNNDMTYGIRMSSAVITVMSGCMALGDNVTKFGIATGNPTGQTLALIACRGAFFHASTSAPVRRQIVQLGCQFEGGNNAGSSNFNTTNQDMIATLLADANGATASTAAWGLEFANGGGSIKRSVYARKEGLFISGSLAFPNAFGEATGPKLIVNAASNITPEGVITAPPASLYLFYNGTTQGKLYVKETGNGNTGWVVK